MTAQREAEIRAATEALVRVLLLAVDDATPAHDLPEKLLSVDAAATQLGLGRSLVYDLIGKGQIRSFLVGRRRLIAAGAVRDFIASRAARAGE